MRILVIAFQMSPARGSEYSVGWGWVRLLAADHQVTVITNDVERSTIEHFLQDSGSRRWGLAVRFIAWNQRWIHSRFWPLVRVVQYACWRTQALREAKNLAATQHFDACHHINGVGFRDVVPLWKTGLPFVWGPVGGAVFVPGPLFGALGWRARAFFTIKNWMNRWSLYWGGRSRVAANRAQAVIAATAEVRSRLESSWSCNAQVVPEVGLPKGIADDVPIRTGAQPLKLVWCARLVEGKALNILLRALPLVSRSVDWELDVVGDGPMRQAWEALTDELGIGARVCFRGAVSRDQAIEAMRSSHVFVMTSLYDLTTNVFCEALTCGLPVVCLAHQAAADYVGEGAGIVVPVETLSQVESGLAQAIVRLADDEQQRRRLARNALLVARQFSWERKGEVLERIYARVAPIDGQPSP